MLKKAASKAVDKITGKIFISMLDDAGMGIFFSNMDFVVSKVVNASIWGQ